MPQNNADNAHAGLPSSSPPALLPRTPPANTPAKAQMAATALTARPHSSDNVRRRKSFEKKQKPVLRHTFYTYMIVLIVSSFHVKVEIDILENSN
jgi:hypothetical protein